MEEAESSLSLKPEEEPSEVDSIGDQIIEQYDHILKKHDFLLEYKQDLEDLYVDK